MAKPTTEPTAEPIRISTNTILNGKFYTAGDPLPVERAEDLPEILRPLVVSRELEPEEPGEARANFQMGEIYRVTDDNRLGRRLQRQVAQMEAATEEQDWIEEQLDAPLPEEVASALQDSYESDVARQAAQAGADARRADELADSVAAEAEPPPLYVKRGSRHYAPAVNARLKAGESVFTRNPEGRFEYVGIVDGHGELPDLPIQL